MEYISIKLKKKIMDIVWHRIRVANSPSLPRIEGFSWDMRLHAKTRKDQAKQDELVTLHKMQTIFILMIKYENAKEFSAYNP